MANMSTTNISRSQTKPETDVLRTLWDQRPSISPLFALGAASLVLVLAYLPNLRALVTVWKEDSNYTHGYLVIPIALIYPLARTLRPGAKESLQSSSSTMVGLDFPGRGLGFAAIMYERGSEWLENSTIILAVAALTWSFGSWPLLHRVWPAIAFLVFMLPLPAVVNRWLPLPLQSFAATSSRFLLQLTGIWVIQEGNVIKPQYRAWQYGTARRGTRLQWTADANDDGCHCHRGRYSPSASEVEANHSSS